MFSLGYRIHVPTRLFKRWKHQQRICLDFLNYIFFQLNHLCYHWKSMPFSTNMFWFFFFWSCFHSSEAIYFSPPPLFRFYFFLWNALCDFSLISSPRCLEYRTSLLSSWHREQDVEKGKHSWGQLQSELRSWVHSYCRDLNRCPLLDSIPPRLACIQLFRSLAHSPDLALHAEQGNQEPFLLLLRSRCGL